MSIQSKFLYWFNETQKNNKFYGDISLLINDLIQDFIESYNKTYKEPIDVFEIRTCRSINFSLYVATCINDFNFTQKERYESAYITLKSTIENSYGVMQIHLVE